MNPLIMSMSVVHSLVCHPFPIAVYLLSTYLLGYSSLSKLKIQAPAFSTQ